MVEMYCFRGVRTILDGVHFVIENTIVHLPQSQKYLCGDERIGNPLSST